MKWTVTVLLCLLLPAAILGQSTSVSATITDQGGQTWNNGTYSFTFQVSPSNPTSQYFWNGSPFSSAQTIQGNLSSLATFSVSVPSNSAITPSGSTWRLQVCPAATATNGCFSLPFTITGATQNLTSAINPPAVVVNLTNPPAGASAYTDSEITGARTGGFYFNLSDSTLHVCTGFPPCTWVSVGSTASILPSNNTFTGLNTFTQVITAAGGITGTGNIGTLGLGATALAANNAWTGAQTHSGAETFANINGAILMDGHTYAFTAAGLSAALAAAGSGTVLIPPATTVALGTSGITLSNTNASIVGLGLGSAISFTGTGNIFTVTAGGVQFSNFTLQSLATANRTSSCMFYATTGNYFVQNVWVVGAATINNGDVFCGTVAGGGAPNVSHVTIPASSTGNPTFNSLVRTIGSSSININDTIIDALYASNVGCADACFVADTATGGWKVTNSVVENYYSGSPPIAINFRNSASSTPPNNIFLLNVFAEAGNDGTVLKIDACHLCNVSSSYLQGGATAVAINGGTHVDINHNQIGSSQINEVSVSAAAVQVKVNDNSFTANGLDSNSNPSVLFAANSNNWEFIGNEWEVVTPTPSFFPNYCLQISAGTSTNFRVVGNDFTSCGALTAPLFLGATGSNQVVWDNTGDADERILNTNGTPLFGGSGLGLIEGTLPGVAATLDICGGATTHWIECSTNGTNFHKVPLIESGTCTMASATTCTFTIPTSFTSTPRTQAFLDGAAAPPATAISVNCFVSGTTVTIQTGASNSLAWDCQITGNPD